MKELLEQECFDFITEPNKDFILTFNDAMTRLGYDFGGKIGSGYCWGKYMIIYTKARVKSKKVYARIYIREDGILLRMFLNDLDQHRAFLENAPASIKRVFTGGSGDCQHCHNQKDGACRFRKTFTIDGQKIEKCNGIVFEFPEPSLRSLPDYLALFTEFYPSRNVRPDRTP